MRLIDADALVKDGYVLHRTYRQDEKTMVHETKRIEDIPTAQIELKWIPCSERLPEVNGDYLVTGRQGAVNKRKYEDGRWYGNWAVLAWMELPAPYKEDAE